MVSEALTNKNDILTEILKKNSPDHEFFENRYGEMPAGNIARTRTIVEHLLAPYYRIDNNKMAIDEFLVELDKIYEYGFGIYSFTGVYNEKMEKLQNLLKELPKDKV